MKVIHSRTGQSIGKNVIAATTFWRRLIGFMFRISPHPYDGIYFPNCKWVHNSFVRFPIDVVFISDDGFVVKIIRDFRPWRFSKIYFKACHVIEFAIGTLPSNVVVGDQLIVKA
jgi:uncharacterized membrane protein (UPF0127 family)